MIFDLLAAHCGSATAQCGKPPAYRSVPSLILPEAMPQEDRRRSLLISISAGTVSLRLTAMLLRQSRNYPLPTEFWATDRAVRSYKRLPTCDSHP